MRFDPRVFIPREEVKRVLAYRDALRSRVLAGHGPTLAPAPGQTSPNLSSTPTIWAYIPSGRRPTSGGVAGQTGGRRSNRGSNVGVPECGEAEHGEAEYGEAERGEAVRRSVLHGLEGHGY